MSKYDYLHALYQALNQLDNNERNRVMRDVEDQFRKAEENDQTESFVTGKLGTPEQYAASIMDAVHESQLQKQTEKIHTTEHMTVGDVELQIIHTIEQPKLIDEITPISQESALQPPISDDKSDLQHPISDVKSDLQHPISEVRTTSSVQPRRSIPPVIQKGNSPIAMILILCGLIFFNATLILAPFITVWAVIFSFATVGIAFTFTGALIVLSGVFTFPLSFVSVPLIVMGHPVLLFSFGFLLIGIGGLLTILMIHIIRFFGLVTGKYAGWNLKLIRGY